jgi:hypothetical protein
MATFNNQLTDVFTTASTVSKCQLTPWSTWWFTSTVTSTVTTTVRVICGVHNDTTDTWAKTLAAVTTGRTDLDVLVLYVADNTDGSSRFQTETANFARWQTHLGVVTFFSHQLGFCSS